MSRKTLNIGPLHFIRCESGAVTADFVVLTGAIAGLGIAVLASVSGGTTTLADKTSGSLGAMSVSDYTAASQPQGGSDGSGSGSDDVDTNEADEDASGSDDSEDEGAGSDRSNGHGSSEKTNKGKKGNKKAGHDEG